MSTSDSIWTKKQEETLSSPRDPKPKRCGLAVAWILLAGFILLIFKD